MIEHDGCEKMTLSLSYKICLFLFMDFFVIARGSKVIMYFNMYTIVFLTVLGF